MRVDLLTKEYPPNVYGGAGVHVTELVNALRSEIDVMVRCFGTPVHEPGTFGYHGDVQLTDANAALGTLSTDLAMVPDIAGADAVHTHTWYANFAGHLAAKLHGIPHIVTSHSLEPLRPWKADQLGGGYALSSFAEKTAIEGADRVIAVSSAMRADILRCYPAVDPEKVITIHNGIDTDRWHHAPDEDFVRSLGLNPDKPLAVFVGRITRQKGLPYLIKAISQLPADTQVLLCAGAPDTPAIADEVATLVKETQVTHSAVVWEQRHLPLEQLRSVLSAATVFLCPSIYEPLGIVNLEAMACGAAVVATRTGGIPEVVLDGETGWLVDIEQVDDGTGTPLDEAKFVADLATAINTAMSDPAECHRRGQAGLRRAHESFTWKAISQTTLAAYRDVIGAKSTSGS